MAPGSHHFLIQFQTYPGLPLRQALARRGMKTLQYVPDSGLMVWAPDTPDLEGLPVAWFAPLTGADKLSPLLARRINTAYLVIFQPDTDMAQARGLVRELGFEVLENPTVMRWHLVLTGSHRRVAELAESDGVAYILPAAPDLSARIPMTGCPGPVAEAGPIGEYVEVGRGWLKNGTGNVGLTYFLQSLTEKLEESTARGEIERAFREWARYANLNFSASSQPGMERQIDVRFARGPHGDAYPFDGPAGALAHTFYPAPLNTEPAAGDVHFDAEEDWHAGTNIDLFTVALHEIGHALGLGHSDSPGAVMYPYYRLSTGLTGDDIAGLRDLYGSNELPPVLPTLPPVMPAVPVPAQPPVETPLPPVQPPSQPPVTKPLQPPSLPPSSDTTPPSLRVVSPGSTMVNTSASKITLSGTASDNVFVTAVKWNNSSGDAGAASGTVNWTATVPLLVGTNVITIRAYDAAGNYGWRSLTVVRR